MRCRNQTLINQITLERGELLPLNNLETFRTIFRHRYLSSGVTIITASSISAEVFQQAIPQTCVQCESISETNIFLHNI